MSKRRIRVFDFDKTIYDGDSMVDFFLFCIRRRPALLRFLPSQLWHIGKFTLRLEDRTTVKTNFFVFLKGVPDINKCVDEFWRCHKSKIRDWFLTSYHTSDVILTASPEFLINPIANELGVSLIATKMDSSNGKIWGKNCYGQEKVRRFKEDYPEAVISEAYGDRESDLPILYLAQKAFIVTGDSIHKL